MAHAMRAMRNTPQCRRKRHSMHAPHLRDLIMARQRISGCTAPAQHGHASTAMHQRPCSNIASHRKYRANSRTE